MQQAKSMPLLLLRISFSAVTAIILLASIAFGQAKTEMDAIYQDESHCLTSPEIRGDEDASISCYCRDAIADTRYVYFTYLLPGKDRNLNGVVLVLESRASDKCGEKYNVLDTTERKDWKWGGPEVVRTYPPDDVIERIAPEAGNPTGLRWVPFTVRLIYRDALGNVTRTESYKSRELLPPRK